MINDPVVFRAHPRRDLESVDADPVTTEVIRHGLNSVAEQMKRALMRTAFSPIIYEVLDFAVGIYDREVRLLAQAASLPVFMGTLSFCVEGAVAAVGGEEALETGDIILYNIPYGTGTHPQDAAMVMPVFTDDHELIGYAAIKAHWLDIGGKDPYATDSVDVFQEGTLFPGVKIYGRGVLNDDMYRTVLANSRVPKMVAGDLNAEVVSLRSGDAGLRRVVARYGTEVFRHSVERMFDHGEATARSYLAKLPDGRYVARGAMDNDGISDDTVEFEVAVEISGSTVTIDYTNAPGIQRGPINCPLPDTVSNSRVAMMMLAGGGEQPNEGHFRPLEVVTRPGSLFHALSPAPCFLVGWASLQAIEVIYHALAQAIPDAVPASSGGDILVLVWWGLREGTLEPWSDGGPQPVGHGGHSRGSGANGLMHISLAATRLAPVEVTEAKDPLLIEKLELAPDSGGAGRSRGGLGVDVRFRALEDCWLTTVIERTENAPWGLLGGKPGRPNSAVLRLGDGDAHPIAKATRVAIPKDATLEVNTGGGGGYGPPTDRDPDAIRSDIREGYITERYAAQHHPGVLEKEGR